MFGNLIRLLGLCFTIVAAGLW